MRQKIKKISLWLKKKRLIEEFDMLHGKHDIPYETSATS